MASKTVTEKLIGDGIIGQVICKRRRINSKNRYDLLRVTKFKHEETVYVMSQKDKGVAEEPLWTPSFIDAEIWARAVSRFRTCESLDRNVENHLLPEMEEYLQSIPDAELVSITRDFLLECGVIHVPISQRAGNTYYFNENEVYSLDKEARLFLYEGRTKFNKFEVRGETCFNMNVWVKAASQFKVGATLEECVEIFLKTELVHRVPKEPSSIDRLAQYISPPIYERVPENQDEATFDYIRMTVGLPRYRFNSWKALQDEVEKHQREIYRKVLQKLESDRQFKSYGVPINFLKLTDAILRRDFAIEFIFELKGQEDSPLPDLIEGQEAL